MSHLTSSWRQWMARINVWCGFFYYRLDGYLNIAFLSFLVWNQHSHSQLRIIYCPALTIDPLPRIPHYGEYGQVPTQFERSISCGRLEKGRPFGHTTYLTRWNVVVGLLDLSITLATGRQPRGSSWSNSQVVDATQPSSPTRRLGSNLDSLSINV